MRSISNAPDWCMFDDDPRFHPSTRHPGLPSAATLHGPHYHCSHCLCKCFVKKRPSVQASCAQRARRGALTHGLAAALGTAQQCTRRACSAACGSVLHKRARVFWPIHARRRHGVRAAVHTHALAQEPAFVSTETHAPIMNSMLRVICTVIRFGRGHSVRWLALRRLGPTPFQLLHAFHCRWHDAG